MSPAELCRSYLESFATGDPERIAAHVTDDFVNEHTAALGGGCVGIEEYRKRLPNFLASMPGLRYDVEEVVADGNRVMAAYTMRAVVNDRDIAIRGVMRFRVDGQLIATRVDYWDSLVFQTQAGLGMRYRTLGHSGIEVSTLALGTMMFGSWGNADESECHRMVDLAIDAGVTLFDTADIYDQGVSEHILGDALRGRRGKVVLATKCGNPMGADPAHRGLSKRWVTQACEDSLRRLDVEHIDLLQAHRPDPDTPIDETIEAFEELIAAGKIRAYGTSTFSPAQLEAAYGAASAKGATAPTSEQPPYSILARGIETGVLPELRRADVGAIVWAPLNGGWLTGKYQGATDTRGRVAGRAPARPLRPRPGRDPRREARRRRPAPGDRRRCGHLPRAARVGVRARR